MYNVSFVTLMKFTQVDLYILYVDSKWHFLHDHFQGFEDLVRTFFDALPIVWYFKPTT